MRSTTKFEDEYFTWLVDKIRLRGTRGEEHSKLLRYLFGYDFYWMIPNDENRAMDGLNLRSRFIMRNRSDINGDCRLPVGEIPCSVLEMLVALAERMERDVLSGQFDEDSTSRWFWIMIKNLGLFDQTNENFVEEYVDCVMKLWLNREYNEFGDGNIFNFHTTFQNQKVVNYQISGMEIWSQMQKWCIENFDF